MCRDSWNEGRGAGPDGDDHLDGSGFPGRAPRRGWPPPGEAVGAGRDRVADRDRVAVHAKLGAKERNWAQTWAGRGTAKPAADRVRRVTGISPAAGDTSDPADLAAAVDQRRRDRLTAQILSRPVPQPGTAAEPGRDSGPAAQRRLHQEPDSDRDGKAR